MPNTFWLLFQMIIFYAIHIVSCSDNLFKLIPFWKLVSMVEYLNKNKIICVPVYAFNFVLFPFRYLLVYIYISQQICLLLARFVSFLFFFSQFFCKHDHVFTLSLSLSECVGVCECEELRLNYGDVTNKIHSWMAWTNETTKSCDKMDLGLAQSNVCPNWKSSYLPIPIKMRL